MEDIMPAVIQAVLEFNHGNSLLSKDYGWEGANNFDIYQRQGGSNSYWSTLMRLGSL